MELYLSICQTYDWIYFILDKNSNYFWFERKEKLHLSGNSYKFYRNSTNDICSNNLGTNIYEEKNWMKIFCYPEFKIYEQVYNVLMIFREVKIHFFRFLRTSDR